MTNRHKHTLIKADIPSSPSVFSLRCHQLHCSVQTEEQPRASDPGNVSLVVTPPVKGAGVVYTGTSNIGLDRFLESNTQIHPILLLDNSKYLYFPPFSLAMLSVGKKDAEENDILEFQQKCT